MVADDAQGESGVRVLRVEQPRVVGRQRGHQAVHLVVLRSERHLASELEIAAADPDQVDPGVLHLPERLLHVCR